MRCLYWVDLDLLIISLMCDCAKLICELLFGRRGVRQFGVPLMFYDEIHTTCAFIRPRGRFTFKELLIMKTLFALKNKLASKKSLKAFAWYIWY